MISSLKEKLMQRSEEIKGFKWLGNHKAHHKIHSCDLPPSVSFLRNLLLACWDGLGQSGAKWWIRVRRWAQGSHWPRPERPSHSQPWAGLSCFPLKLAPGKSAGQVDSWLISTVLQKSSFSGLPKKTLPWPWTPEPNRMSPNLNKHGKQVGGSKCGNIFWL